MAFDLTADIINTLDIIDRYEELESELEDIHGGQETTLSFEYWLQDVANCPEDSHEDFEEFNRLKDVLDELKGNGGDEQWRGDWYPGTLISESYFEEAMDELLEDCGELPKDLPSYLTVVVDYDALRMDYTSVDVDGETYFYR